MSSKNTNKINVPRPALLWISLRWKPPLRLMCKGHKRK